MIEAGCRACFAAVKKKAAKKETDGFLQNGSAQNRPFWVLGLVFAVGTGGVGIGAATLVLGARGLFVCRVCAVCRILAVAAVLVLGFVGRLVIQTNHLLRALFLTA